MGPQEGRDPRVQREGREKRIDLRSVLAEHGVRPDKRFGQHFLVSDSVVKKIVARVDGCSGVLEIGPGPGVLTAPLLAQGRTVTVVELDSVILPVLREVAPSALIIEGDALEVDLALLADKLPTPRALVSNMPYNITGPLLDRFSSIRGAFTKLVLMMQREVGDKIVAQPGDSGRGALSVVMQALFEIQRVALVPPGAFLPPPRVDSIVLEFLPKPRTDHLEPVFHLVRTGFTMPRKTLLNNLGKGLGREQAQALLKRSGIDPTLRPHQLTWSQWLTLAN